MKNVILLAIAAIIISSCSIEKKEKNVVNDIMPVHRWDNQTKNLLDSLQSIPDAQKLEFINRNLPHLVPGIIGQIEQRVGKIHVDSLVFSFGSGKAKGVLDSAGVHHDGIYENELIARIWTNPATKLGNPIIVFVRCLNGTIDIKGDKRIGTAPLEFVIQKREGLCHHLDFETSIWLADRFDLPLFSGKKFREKDRISPAKARALKNNLNKVQVSVLVFEGDRFILGGPGVEPAYIRAKRY